MQAEVETKSLELLAWLETAIKATVDFTARETPILIQELLTYNFYMSLGNFTIWTIFLLLTCFGIYKLFKWIYKSKSWEFFPIFPILIIPIMLGVMGMSKNTDWIKIKLAPRVYLLEYAREMLNK